MSDSPSAAAPNPHDPNLVVQNKKPWVVALGDCLETLRTLPDNCIDAVVSDPPYGMSEDPDVRMMIRKWMLTEAKFEHKSKSGFMGREWDAFVPGPEVWKEVFRVLKPGGHLLAFCATRTWDLLSVAIRFAGFENRDTIACYGPPGVSWTYGQGFPKSMSIDKAIDKAHVRDKATGELVFHGTIEEVRKVTGFIKTARDKAGVTNAQIDALFGTVGMAGHWTSTASQPAIPSWDQWLGIKQLLGCDDSMDTEVWRLNRRKGKPGEGYTERDVTGQHDSAPAAQIWQNNYNDAQRDLTPKEQRDEPLTPLAQQWKGWGTALKPSWEVVLVFRKPLAEKTVVEQVLQSGTGAINIDDTRVGTTKRVPGGLSTTTSKYTFTNKKPAPEGTSGQLDNVGRWPSNQILVHGPGCKKVGTRKVKSGAKPDPEEEILTNNEDRINRHAYGKGLGGTRTATNTHGDSDGFEEIEDWECMPGCPIAALDAQSGFSESSDRVRMNVAQTQYKFGGGKPEGRPSGGYSDEGGASRFFPRFAFEEGEVEDELAAQSLGRWPSNVTLCHLPTCEYQGEKKVDVQAPKPFVHKEHKASNTALGNNIGTKKAGQQGITYADQEGKETVEEWKCAPGCPVEEMRRQSPVSGSGAGVAAVGTIKGKTGDGTWGERLGKEFQGVTDFGDRGGAERFYPSFHWEPGEFEKVFHYHAKISTRERNEGLPEGVENRHPTVKPSSLMRWLVRLVTPKKGVVLDPFCGSGTTGMAAIWEGMRFIGCELEAPSADIARRRCQFAAVRPKKQR